MIENAILITGASRRVGLFLAESFLKQADYSVVVTYRTQSPEIQGLQELGALTFEVDLTNEIALSGFIKKLYSQVKSLRLLVHNASIWADDQQVAENPNLF